MEQSVENGAGRLEQVLERWWGYKSFRPMQREIVESVLAGCDTLALMPTGGGKSLLYQLPTMAGQGLCIVVTPLIALMKDQVDRLRSRGIAAVAVHSGMDARRIDIALDNCAYGDVKFLYIAPERLATDTFRLRLQRMNVALLAVDEAHCISQWGYDFRPSYRRIAEIRRLLPGVPVLALTASATETVAADIMDSLSFGEPRIMRSSFARPNLSYVVRRTEDKFGQLVRMLSSVAGSAIVYMRTRDGVEQLCAQLTAEGVGASFYHGGLPGEERSIRQEEWTSGKVRVMVATNAFGMGIDKADVRLVVHYSMCDSLEAYYQEAGRAGRDGRRSYAVLLCSADDPDRIAKRFEAEFPPIEDIKRVYERISNYLQVAVGDGRGASFVFNIHDFCRRERLYAGRVVGALKLLQQNGYMTLLDEDDNPARLMFTAGRDDLYRLHAGSDRYDAVLRAILRLYNGVFSSFRPIDDNRIAAAAGCDVHCVRETLKSLWRMHVIRYIPSSRSPMILFDTERLPTADLYIAPQTYRRRYDMMHERFSNMLRYAESDEECRSVAISRYFGEHDAAPCGVCDVCLDRKHRGKRGGELPEKILSLLKIRPMSVRELIDSVGGDARRAAEAVDKLISEGKISLGAQGKLAIIE